MITALPVISTDRKEETKPCICSKEGIEIWVNVPDERGDVYPYPLKNASFCPTCGRHLQVDRHD